MKIKLTRRYGLMEPGHILDIPESRAEKFLTKGYAIRIATDPKRRKTR